MYQIYKITSSPVVDFAAEELKKYLRMMMPRGGEIAISYKPDATDGFRLGLMEDFGLDISEAEDPELDEALDASLLPATGVALPGEMPRMVFHGIPGGKEITAFASAVLTAGGGMKPLDKPTLKDIAKVKNPMVLQICVSLGCQHCSQLVSSAHRVAWENPLITAHMIDANLYPALVKEYDIQRVPLTVIDRKRFVPGGKTMAELTSLLARYK